MTGMQKFIHNLAVAAILLVLVISLWEGWSLVPTMKRMALAYIGFSLIGSAFALGVKIILGLENKTTGPAAGQPGSGRTDPASRGSRSS